MTIDNKQLSDGGSHPVSRIESITLSITEQRKREIENRAECEDITVSSHLTHPIERQFRIEADDGFSTESMASEELKHIINKDIFQHEVVHP